MSQFGLCPRLSNLANQSRIYWVFQGEHDWTGLIAAEWGWKPSQSPLQELELEPWKLLFYFANAGPEMGRKLKRWGHLNGAERLTEEGTN